jgi:hypothetical protein
MRGNEITPQQKQKGAAKRMQLCRSLKFEIPVGI